MRRFLNSFTLPDKYQQWLRRNDWWIIICLALFTTIYFVFALGNWAPWTGFKGKTLWDWLELLGVPITLAAIGYFLQQQAEKRSRDEAKDEILETYFDRLSELLVDKNLLAIATKLYPNDKTTEDSQSEGDVTLSQEKQVDNREAVPSPIVTRDQQELFDAAIDVIRARTLSILRRFQGDGERKTSVIQFLIEAEVISKAKLDLRQFDLSGIDLRVANLSGAYLRAANLSRTDLRVTDLSSADLAYANLSFAKLNSARLNSANLSNADLTEANCVLAKIDSANLSSANLSRAHFFSANLSKADLSGANLRESKFTQADLSGANLSGANLIESDFFRANLSKANLSGATLVSSNFFGANLSKANLSETDLGESKFFGVNFSAADFTGSNLSKVSFFGANLEKICWSSATVWPDKAKVANAQNIPEELKQELGIT